MDSRFTQCGGEIQPGPGSGPARARFGAAGGGYDATLPRGKRKVPLARSRSEDAELNNNQRMILGGTTRDLRRNFAVAAWAIRQHLDYVSTFNFQCRCRNSRRMKARWSQEELANVDDQVESIVRTWSRAQNFDAGGRHSLPRMIRLAEALRTVDGDTLPIQRRDKKIQLVESDRIKNPIGAPSDATGLSPADMLNVINGVLIDPSTGAAQGYCVHKRDRSGMSMTFDRLVPAKFAALHGYFDRYDQVRGISPVAAAVNQYRDLYESFDYTLAKEKVAQLFAMVIFRKQADNLGILDKETEVVDDGTGDGGTVEKDRYKLDFGRGPIMLDLDPGDDAKFLNSANPSEESQAFWQLILMIALKSLDIPLCFFDESHANWPGLRQAWLKYDLSAESKRTDNRELLDRWTAWRLVLAVMDEELTLPAGMMITDLAWEWVARGVPWLDQLKEVTADIAAVGAGLDDPQSILKAQGKDPFEVIDRIAEFKDYAESKGVTLSFVPPVIQPADAADAADGDAAGGNSGKPAKRPAKKTRGSAAK
jgi:capsid protein